MSISMIQNSQCQSYFENNDFLHNCEIMYRATQTLFPAPSLGLVKKGGPKNESLPQCPTRKFFTSVERPRQFAESLFKKLYNLSMHEWKRGELESYQSLATSKVKQIAKQLGFEGDIDISPMGVEQCAKFGEVRHVTAGIYACKPFYHDLIGFNGLELQQEAEGTVAHEIGHHNLPDFLISSDYKYEEIKADLYTLRNARLARGMLNGLIRTQTLVPYEIEVPLRGENPSHPYLYERIQYLTEGLCAIYPEKNRDIC